MTVHTKFVTVTIGEMLDNDEKAFLDIIAGRAFGTAGAQEIDFRAAGVAGDMVIELEVTAEMPEKSE